MSKTKLLVVGFTTEMSDGLERLNLSQLKVSEEVPEPENIAALKTKLVKLQPLAKECVHVSRLKSVHIIDPQVGDSFDSSLYAGKNPGCSIAVGTALWLIERYPDAWTSGPLQIHSEHPDTTVSFLGFNMRLFVKMLGLECAAAGLNPPLPPDMWYTNADHRDMEAALLPTGCTLKDFTLKQAMQSMNLFAHVPELSQEWEYGKDAMSDVIAACGIARILGFLPTPKAAPEVAKKSKPRRKTADVGE